MRQRKAPFKVNDAAIFRKEYHIQRGQRSPRTPNNDVARRYFSFAFLLVLVMVLTLIIRQTDDMRYDLTDLVMANSATIGSNSSATTAIYASTNTKSGSAGESITTTQEKDIFNDYENAAILYTVPNSPDLSIGEWLRKRIKIPKANSKSNSTTGTLHTYLNPLSTCSPTSQIRIRNKQLHVQENDTSIKSSWIIEALDEKGRKKSIGGDEFFITYTDNNDTRVNTNSTSNSTQKTEMPTAVAITKDNRDGTYDLDFVSPPSPQLQTYLPNEENELLNVRLGTLRISIVFTCGIGRMTRPTKDEWVDGGHLYSDRHTYYISNVTAPPIRQVKLPNMNLHTSASTSTSPSNSSASDFIDMSRHERVICFGDSMVRNLCGMFPKQHYQQSNMEVRGKVGSILRSDTLDYVFDILDEDYGEDLNNSKASSSSTTSLALILDSANWELEGNSGPLPGHYFNNSLQMYYEYVQGIRARYPNVTLYWKSPQAIHPTALMRGSTSRFKCYEKKACRDRVRYASLSSMEYLYWEQKRIMKELDVPFLDLWEVSYVSESWHKEGDAAHYKPDFNKYLLDFFYPESMSLLNKSPTKKQNKKNIDIQIQ